MLELALSSTALLAAGGLLWAALAFLARRLTPWRFVAGCTWGPLEALLVLCASILAAMVLGGLFLGLSGHPGNPEDTLSFGATCLVQLLAHLVTLALIWALVRREGAGSVPRMLGFRPGGNLRAALLGALAFAVMIPLVQALAGYQEVLWRGLFGEAPGRQEILVEALALAPGPGRWAIYAYIGLFVPLVEEILFRAFVQPALTRTLGVLSGVLCTALVFALVHSPEVWLPIFGFALMLGWLYQRTGRIASCVGLHAILNISSLLIPQLATRQ